VDSVDADRAIRTAAKASKRILRSMLPTDRFADRFLADRYARDEVVQLDYGDPT
jgi:hypothetical protein